MRQQILVIALLMAFFVMPTAFAEEETEINLTSDDEREAKDISYSNGARVRLLELEKRIARNILIGTKVVEVLNESNSTANLTKLQSILDEMEDLLEEIKNTDIEGNKTELAKEYVAFKREAINLTQLFRDEAMPYVNPAIRQDIAVTTNLIDTAALRNLTEEIKEAKCVFNANRIESMLGELKGKNPELVGRVRSCNATKEDIAMGINQSFRNLGIEEKKNLRDKFRENTIKKNIEKKEFIAEVKANLTAMQLQRHLLVMERIENRSILMNRTRAAESINDVIARISNMTGRDGEKHGLRTIGTVVMPGGDRR